MVLKNVRNKIKELKRLYNKVKAETREEIKESCLKEELRFYKAYFKEIFQLIKEEG